MSARHRYIAGVIWEPCAGRGAMAAVLAKAGHHVIASDLVHHEGAVYPIFTGIDARVARSPAEVQVIVTNPPYGPGIKPLPALVEHFLELLKPVNGQLFLLLKSQWGESQQAQALTSAHPAFHARIKLPRRIVWFGGGTGKDNHAWYWWDWTRDPARPPLELSTGDRRLRRACAICKSHLRRDARTCSSTCRALLSYRRRRAPGAPGDLDSESL